MRLRGVPRVVSSQRYSIRIDARDHIEPTFRVPAIRVDNGYMEPDGIEPTTSCVQSRRSPS